MDEVVEALEKYQGLVPLVYDIETMSLDEARSEDMQYAVYLKREADKFIADLEESHKKEVGQLLIEIAELKKEKEYVIEHTTEVINGQESELRELKASIAELEEECRWRKFPDEKPKEDVQVFVYEGRPGFRSIQTDVYTRDDGFTSTRVPRFKTYGDYVTHWMPLPSAPKEEK